MALTTAQRKANIKRALSKVRKSTGGFVVTRKVASGITAGVKGIARPGPTQTTARVPVKPSGADLNKIATQKFRALRQGSVRRVETKPDGTVIFFSTGGGKFTFEKGFSTKQIITDAFGQGVNITGKSLRQIQQIKSLQVPVRTFSSLDKQRQEQLIKRVTAIATKQARKNRKFVIGQIPRRDAVIKTFNELSTEERIALVSPTPFITPSLQRKIDEKIKAIQIESKFTGKVEAVKAKGLTKLQQIAAAKRAEQRTLIARAKTPEEKIFRGVVVLGLIGAGRGAIGVAKTVSNPLQAAKNLFKAAKQPVITVRTLGQQFTVDPVGVVAEFWVYNKGLNLAGKFIKKSPVGRFVSEELFIRTQPKAIRPAVRKIIKSAKVQEKINPNKIKTIKKVDFMEVKSLTKTEARALSKTLQQTDSVVFGSLAARTLSKKRTPLPKDVDLATRSISQFNRQFIANLPKRLQKGYAIKGQKIIRLSNKEAIMDVKPLDRLIPQRSLFTGKGELPVIGFIKKFKKPKPGSLLPRIVRKPGVSRLTIPTQKIVTVKGIKLTGFGEQTTRKALGTLQVLIEKSSRRAKDPQSFLIALEIQLKALKKARPFTKLGRIRWRSRIETLSSTIKLLKSKQFAKLLEQKVPGILKNFPLVSKINLKALKNIDLKKVRQAVAKKLPKVAAKKPTAPSKKSKKLIKDMIKQKGLPKTISSKKLNKAISRLPKNLKRRFSSSLPSRLPKRVSSSLLSKVPSSLLAATLPTLLSTLKGRKVSIIPVTKGNSILSVIPQKRLSGVPISTLRQMSRVPKSILKNSKLPPSKVPLSAIPASSLVNTNTKKVIKIVETEIRRKKEKKKEEPKKKKKIRDLIKTFIFQSDLVNRIFGVRARPELAKKLLKRGRIFSGIERRPIITLKDIKRLLKR